ncbi:MAG: helix-turn-helix transcriptional regulator, partial [Gammaproteobacteria bacterium]|nr:helix-turn-helix transcriptional regulator [Gammaproteobacteria bacterium]
MKTIGERLNHLLRINNVTQQELAGKVKVTKQTISQLCADKIYNSKAVFPIAKYFGVDLDWLLIGKSTTGHDTENNSLVLDKFHKIPVFTTRMLDKTLLIKNKLTLNTKTPEYELTADPEFQHLFAMTSTNNAMKIRFGLCSTLLFHTNLQAHDGDFVIVYLPEKDLFIYRDLKIEKNKK